MFYKLRKYAYFKNYTLKGRSLFKAYVIAHIGLIPYHGLDAEICSVMPRGIVEFFLLSDRTRGLITKYLF